MTRDEKFFVLALPRSRTKWLSEFLSFGGKVCGHDLSVECASAEDFALAISPLDGSAETAAVLGWKLLRDRWPKARFLTVHRPVAEVANSLWLQGIRPDWEELMLREQMLLACAHSSGVMSVTFEQLKSFDICSAVFGHCLEMGLEYDYWAELSNRVIQIDMAERIERLRLNASALASFRLDIASRSSSLGESQWTGLN